MFECIVIDFRVRQAKMHRRYAHCELWLTARRHLQQATMCMHVSCVRTCVCAWHCVGAQNVDTQLLVQLQKKGMLDLPRMVKQASAVQLLHDVHACVMCVCAWHCVGTWAHKLLSA